MKELIYVTYTCKKCGKAFLDIDKFNDIDEIPLKTRYCPECVVLGYKNEKHKRNKKQEDVKITYFKERIKLENIQDERDIAFLIKEYKKIIKRKEEHKMRINTNYIFNEALEVLGYQDWKQ